MAGARLEHGSDRSPVVKIAWQRHGRGTVATGHRLSKSHGRDMARTRQSIYTRHGGDLLGLSRVGWIRRGSSFRPESARFRSAGSIPMSIMLHRFTRPPFLCQIIPLPRHDPSGPTIVMSVVSAQISDGDYRFLIPYF
ncbi:hypothetical protein J6590_010576 [Homalodisca vitripennis]|nr:hypothetical protein J6590_010576 [Homalodisca vitripennis]